MVKAHIPTPEELELFSSRIARSLAERPLTLPAGEHREQVARLLREVGEASHYSLLGVDQGASVPRIHEGYERVARIVHTANAARLDLLGKEAVLEMLFERVTLAYLTLSHPERRRLYDRDAIPGAGGGEPRTRGKETAAHARQNYEHATILVAREDYHFAVELLREAVRIDPRAEYYGLLGEVQAKNENWLHHAAESYSRALELGGPDPAFQAALQDIRLRLASAADGASAGEGDSRRRGRKH